MRRPGRRGSVRSVTNLLRRAALILSAGLIASAAFALPVHAAAGHQTRATAQSRGAKSLAGRQARTGAGAWRLARVFSVPGHVPGRSVVLSDIDAVGPADAWVLGAIQNAGNTVRALVGHWNGRAWSRVAVPPVLAARFRGAVSSSIAASSSRNVWAFSTDGTFLRLTGNRWQFGRAPRRVVTRKDFLGSAEVLSPTNVWVFGSHVIGSIYSLKFVPFAARFDGRRWHAVKVRGVGSMGPVSVVSPASMWALTGVDLPALGLPEHPKVVHWNGSAWRPMAVQPRLPRNATLTAILAYSSRDVWVGGSVANHKSGSSEMALHWNGTSWATVSPPARASAADEFLTSLVPDGSGGLWAVAEAIPGPARFWHYTNGGWAPPVPVRSDWLYPALAGVPGSQSVWAIAASPGFTRGLILVHGARPR
jgi:hypothetical protein